MSTATLLWIAACILIADFITGFVHWFEDTFLTLKTPLLGKLIGAPNIEHHRNPGQLAKTGNFIKRNAASATLGVLWVSLSWFFDVLVWQMVLIAVVAAFGNEVHEWNHSAKPKNSLVAFIQDSGLVQSRRQHALHHRKPYAGYYCTLTNFTNAVLERLNFWRGLEWVFVTFLRLKVQRLSPARDGF